MLCIAKFKPRNDSWCCSAGPGAHSSMSRDIRIVVIGRTTLVREGLWALLSAQQGIQVSAVLEGDVEAIQSVVERSVPDVAVMHFSVVAPGGLDAVSAVRTRWPSTRIIALVHRPDERTVSTATEAGVDGCVSESDSLGELLCAIRAVANAERYLTRPIAQHEVSSPGQLTEREKEVTRLIAAGLRTREIAERLSVSVKTIEKHRSSIMRKLGLRSAAAVAAYATSHGHLFL